MSVNTQKKNVGLKQRNLMVNKKLSFSFLESKILKLKIKKRKNRKISYIFRNGSTNQNEKRVGSGSEDGRSVRFFAPTRSLRGPKILDPAQPARYQPGAGLLISQKLVESSKSRFFTPFFQNTNQNEKTLLNFGPDRADQPRAGSRNKDLVWYDPGQGTGPGS